MSGRKYSQVELAAQVHDAIRCRIAAEQALGAAEALARALTDAARTVAALRDVTSVVQSALTELRAAVESMRHEFSESALMKLDPTRMRARRARVDGLRARLDAIARSCEAGQGAAGVRIEAARLAEQVRHERETLRPWLGEEYDGFASSVAASLKETDREIRTTGSAARGASRVRQASGEFDRLVAQVATRREQHADRQYIAEALAKICHDDLGFGVTIRPSASPIEDLIVEIDTFAYGLLQFRLTLDGTVRSQSEAMMACPVSFGTIEKRLRALGVVSDFRYEGDQRPVVIDKEERPVPNGVRAGAKELG